MFSGDLLFYLWCLILLFKGTTTTAPRHTPAVVALGLPTRLQGHRAILCHGLAPKERTDPNGGSERTEESQRRSADRSGSKEEKGTSLGFLFHLVGEWKKGEASRKAMHGEIEEPTWRASKKVSQSPTSAGLSSKIDE